MDEFCEWGCDRSLLNFCKFKIDTVGKEEVRFIHLKFFEKLEQSNVDL